MHFEIDFFLEEFKFCFSSLDHIGGREKKIDFRVGICSKNIFFWCPESERVLCNSVFAFLVQCTDWGISNLIIDHCFSF